jgi:hypothetical protein
MEKKKKKKNQLRFLLIEFYIFHNRFASVKYFNLILLDFREFNYIPLSKRGEEGKMYIM